MAVANGVQTSFTQDLAAPLSQLLQSTQGTTTTTYLYGLERLASVSGSTRTWYTTDALGSVRHTLSDTGARGTTVHYDPWGTPEGTATPPTCGFTGEFHDTGIGLINLRARWYQPGQGRFLTRDPFAGFATQPYSLHPYQYAYSNPVRYTDPSGHYPGGDSSLTMQCVAGIAKQWLYDNSFGLARSVAPLPSESAIMQWCRQLGNALALAQGVAEVLGGGGAALGGGGLCLSGIGAVAGAPAAAAGAAVAVHGVSVVGAAVRQAGLLANVMCATAGNGSGGGGGVSGAAGGEPQLTGPEAAAVESAIAAEKNLPKTRGTTVGAATARDVQTKSNIKDDEDILDKVMELEREIGHPIKASGAADNGTVGYWQAAHAEKKMAIRAPNEPLAVSKEMCPDCQRFYQALARKRQRTQVVADPEFVRLFRPDGTVIPIPR